MKEIYKKIWQLAKPYYKKGRPMDISHIEWMTEEAKKVCHSEDIDDSLFIPLVILHDVGYAEQNGASDKDPFNQDLKRNHMISSERISRRILTELDYPKDKLEKILYYISVHDNWNLGDDKPYKADKILATFNDLDFIWLAVKKGFEEVRKMIDKNPAKMIEFVEKSEKITRRPFATKTTRNIFYQYLSERKKEIN